MERTKEAIQELAKKTGAEIKYKGGWSTKTYEITIKTEKYLNLAGLLLKKGLVKTVDFWSTDVEVEAVKFRFEIHKDGSVGCWIKYPNVGDNEGDMVFIIYNGEIGYLFGMYSLEEIADFIKKQAIIIPKYFNEYRKLTPKKYTTHRKLKDKECPKQKIREWDVSEIKFE
jgi:hypothetical protein